MMGGESEEKSVVFNSIEFEYPVFKMRTFDQSLDRLLFARYQRHPLPSEVYGLKIAGLEGKLDFRTKNFSELAIYRQDTQWLSLCFERKPYNFRKDKLIAYVHPSGIVWNARNKIIREGNITYVHIDSDVWLDGEYVIGKFKYDHKTEFLIDNKLGHFDVCHQRVDYIKDFPADFVRFIFGTIEVRKEMLDVGVLLPKYNSGIMPMSRGTIVTEGFCGEVISPENYCAVSQGIKVI